MYVVAINKGVIILSIITFTLLAGAIVAELTTEEELSKQIVMPILYFAIITSGATAITLARNNREFQKLR